MSEKECPPSRGAVSWGAFAVLIVAAAYLALWWNQYLPPVLGHDLYYSSQFAHGRIPYRDYLFVSQPGNILSAVLISSLFGPRMVVFWLFGAVVRVLSMVCLYFWMVRSYRPTAAALGVLTMSVVSCGDIADVAGSYHNISIAYLVFGALFACLSLERAANRLGCIWAVLSGLFLAMNFLTKQTTGVLVVPLVMVLTAGAAWKLHGVRRAGGILGSMLLVPLVAVGLVWLWLYRNQALTAYFDQVFFTGPSSKGALYSIFARPFLLTLQVPEYLCHAILALMILGGVCVFWSLVGRPGAKGAGTLLPAGVYLALLGLLAVLLGRLAVFPLFDSRTPALTAVYVALVCSFVLAVNAMVAVAHGNRDLAAMQKLLLTGVAFATCYALSISWAAYEVMTLPALAVVVASLWELHLAEHYGRAWRTALVIVCLLVMAVGTWHKQIHPFDWGYWAEPPLTESVQVPRTPALAGFRLSAGTAKFYDEVTRLIQAHSGPEEAILVYPHLHIFYALADRRPATFAYMHWWDVCPDRIAIEDARRIRKHPPAVIVSMEISPEAYATQESWFREGKPSGQRQLAAAIAELVKDYDLVGKFAAPGSDFSIGVWARRKPGPVADADSGGGR